MGPVHRNRAACGYGFRAPLAYACGPGMTEGARARAGMTGRSYKLRAMSTFMISLVPA
jgi:hypothetical protein